MAKVEEVQTSQVRKEHKMKDKPKKSKSKRPRTKGTDLKQAKSQPVEPPPNGHVQGDVRDREATINESPEQSQIGRKKKRKSTYKSQSSTAIHSDIARYVQLAQKTVGKSATTAYTKHLSRSLNLGISAALKEVQIIRTSQPEQVIKQKLRDKVLQCINGRSPYTEIRQVLVTLDKFIKGLQVQVTAAQLSMADQMEPSPCEKQGKWREKDQQHVSEPGQVNYIRPLDSQVQWQKNTTFSRDVILIIWRPSVLVHLRAMTKEDMLSIVESAFQRVSPHSDSRRALRWLSHATITDSGNVKVSMHTKDPNELNTLTEEMTTGWARILQNEAEQSSRVFEVLVPNFPVDPSELVDPCRKAETIKRLVRHNASRISSLTRPDDIREIQIARSNGEASRGTTIVLVFNSCQLANNVIENGLDWNGEHHRCEALGTSELLERCERCQIYTHTANSCTNTVRCEKCAEPHFTRFCKSIDFTCAVCSGGHPAYSEACTARNAARDEIQKVRFAPDSEEDHPQLITSCIHHGKNLGSTSPRSHSEAVLEKIRRLRQEVLALEEGLTFGLESREQRSVSTGVPSKKVKSRSNISGKVQQAVAIAGLSAPSIGNYESRKRKAKDNTTDQVQPEATFDKKRVKREDSAFDQCGYQWTPDFYGPRE